MAVKVLRGRRAAATSIREAKMLSLAPHAHLAWTLAVVTHVASERVRVSWARMFGREVRKSERSGACMEWDVAEGKWSLLCC